MNDTPETNESTQWYEGIGWAVPARLAAKLEQERDAIAEQQDKLAEALQKLADCDWVITPRDRMDAVRSIAKEALQFLNSNKL